MSDDTLKDFDAELDRRLKNVLAGANAAQAAAQPPVPPPPPVPPAPFVYDTLSSAGQRPFDVSAPAPVPSPLPAFAEPRPTIPSPPPLSGAFVQAPGTPGAFAPLPPASLSGIPLPRVQPVSTPPAPIPGATAPVSFPAPPPMFVPGAVGIPVSVRVDGVSAETQSPYSNLFAGTVPARGPEAGSPRRHALLVALGSYDEASWKRFGCLPGERGSAIHDLRNMEELCRKSGGWGDVVTLFDSSATVSNIRRAFAHFASFMGPGDEFLFFFSSHGGRDEKSAGGNDTFLCAYDGPYVEADLRDDVCSFNLGVKAISVISACHSAGLFRTDMLSSGSGFDPEAFLKFILSAASSIRDGSRISPSDVGWIVSADKDQSSLRSMNETGSLFASYAIAKEGWFGGAADGLAKAVIDANDTSAVRSTADFLKVKNIAPQQPTGRVSFLDLALYAVRKWKDVDIGRGERSVPQFCNAAALASVVAGRTGSV